MRTVVALLAGVAIVVNGSLVVDDGPLLPIVNTTLGLVQGFVDGDVNVFLSIPFAASTGGENRFLPPRQREPWGDEVLNCTQVGPGCVQGHHNADVPCGGKDLGPRCQSEDCLNLNVYVPRNNKSSKAFPAMIWLYGGAFEEGMNWGPVNLYQGTQFAAKERVCIVEPNYRLGVLGSLVWPGQQHGNQQILDQRMAMMWVRDNIANFGCDPNSVTIWGESAGAMSVAVHLVSPGSAGLFHRAIMESNVAGFQYQNEAAQRLTFGQNFLKLSGCGDWKNISCLQEIDAHDVIEYGEKASGSALEGLLDRILEDGHVEDAFAMQWSPVIDMFELTAQPLQLFDSGKWNHVPVLLGSNQDEGATFIYAGIRDKIPELLFPLLMDAIFTKSGKNVTEFYSEASENWHDARDSLSYILTDYWFKCSAAKIALAASKKGMNSYVYRFDHVLSFPQLFPMFGLPDVCENRTCHASEIPFVFGNYANFSVDQDELDMSSDFFSYWGSFARTADVNDGISDGERPYWPLFNSSSRLNMRIGIPRLVESTKTGQQGSDPALRHTEGVCDFFDRIVGYNH